MKMEQAITITTGRRIHHHRSGLEAMLLAAFCASALPPVRADACDSGSISAGGGGASFTFSGLAVSGGVGEGEGGGEGGEGGRGENEGGGGGGSGGGDGGGGDRLETSLSMPASLE